MEQETITDERAAAAPVFDPAAHTLWTRFVDNGRVAHSAWLAAVHEGLWVGTCGGCGDYLVPQPPYVVSKHRTDYEARCRRPLVSYLVDGVRQVDGCGGEVMAPGGRVATRRTRRSGR